MQRRAQRADLGARPTPFRPWARDQRDERSERGRRAVRRRRALAGTAVLPVVLLAAACSGDSGSDSGSGSGSVTKAGQPTATASASPSPTVRAAVYTSLPEACGVLSEKTLKDLVPQAGKSGKEGSSNDVESRGSCSWDSLDNNGVKGSQFRWLNVSLLRFESDVTRGAGDELAEEYYDRQVEDAQGASGAKNVKSAPVAGTGDEATAVRYDLKKKEGAFKQQTVVARVENVVVTVDYSGAGLAGDKTPDADELMKDAQKAAKEAVAAVQRTSGGSTTGSASPSVSGSPKSSGSPEPSGSTAKSAS